MYRVRLFMIQIYSVNWQVGNKSLLTPYLNEFSQTYSKGFSDSIIVLLTLFALYRFRDETDIIGFAQPEIDRCLVGDRGSC